MEYRELLKNYGLSYLSDTAESMWDDVYGMDDINYMFEDQSHLDILEMASKGYNYTLTDEEKPFNPDKEYFAINSYGGLISIDSRLLPDFIETEMNIDKEDFMDWCKEEGYIDYNIK